MKLVIWYNKSLDWSDLRFQGLRIWRPAKNLKELQKSDDYKRSKDPTY
jgi:hypothetical protein